MQLEKPEKEQKMHQKPVEEIIVIRAEINEIENRKQKVQKIIETKNWFFGKINKIDRPLTAFMKKKKNQN